MKPPIQSLSGLKGTIMVFALVIILAGTLVLAAWAQMMATAAAYPDATAQGVQNRIALENGRALARQYLLTSLPSGSNSTWVASISNGAWGGCSISNSSWGLWIKTNQMEGNPFSPLSGKSFFSDVFSSISNSTQSKGWKFLIKSRSPLLLGYPVVLHNKPTTPVSSLNWVTNNSVIYWTNVMSNRPNISAAASIPFTSGTNASLTNGYVGYFAAPPSIYSETYSLGTDVANDPLVSRKNILYKNQNTNGASLTATTNSPNGSGGTNYTNWYTGGTAEVYIDTYQANAILRYKVPETIPETYTNITSVPAGSGTNTTYGLYTNMLLTHLTLRHDRDVTTPSYTPNVMHVIVPPSNTNLAVVELTGITNNRRIFLNVQSTNALVLKTTVQDKRFDWKFALSSSAPINIEFPTGGYSMNITGGIRTDKQMTINSGNLNITADTDPSFDADIIFDRILWIEDGENR